MRARVCCGIWLAPLLMMPCIVVWGQGSKPGTGIVTGQVTCGDTQKPARFAQVLLISVPSAVTPMGKVDGTDPNSIQAFTKAMTDAMKSTSFVLSQTGFDGSFAVEDVTAGDYYVMASGAVMWSDRWCRWRRRGRGSYEGYPGSADRASFGGAGDKRPDLSREGSGDRGPCSLGRRCSGHRSVHIGRAEKRRP